MKQQNLVLCVRCQENEIWMVWSFLLDLWSKDWMEQHRWRHRLVFLHWKYYWLTLLELNWQHLLNRFYASSLHSHSSPMLSYDDPSREESTVSVQQSNCRWEYSHHRIQCYYCVWEDHPPWVSEFLIELSTLHWMTITGSRKSKLMILSFGRNVRILTETSVSSSRAFSGNSTRINCSAEILIFVE